MSASFEDLEVWQKSCRLSVDIYQLLKNCRDYGFRDQMCRASVSIASNIAEGSERGTDCEFVRFLNIAKGSAAELRTQLYIAVEIGVIARDNFVELLKRIKSVSQMLQALINSIKGSSKTVNGKRPTVDVITTR